MVVPHIAEFHEILSAITIDDHCDRQKYAPADPLPNISGLDETGRLSIYPDYRIWYPVGTRLSFHSLLEKVQKELKSRRHPDGHAFATLFLAAFCLKRDSEKPVELFNQVLDTLCTADLNQYYIFTLPYPPNWSYEMPPFRIGPLRRDRLERQCRKAGSDFFDRYGAQLKNHMAVERAHTAVVIPDIERLRSLLHVSTLDVRQAPLWRSIVENYFFMRSQGLFEDFWELFEKRQYAPVVAGAPFIQPKRLKERLATHGISVYLNIGNGRQGYVANTRGILSIMDFAGANTRVPNAIRMLSEIYLLHHDHKHDFDVTIDTFCRYACRGN
jgi:hypothetical protein